jgi:hypothetical protein
LGTIFRVTLTVFYRRIWNIVGKYSILCCDNRQQQMQLIRGRRRNLWLAHISKG